MNKRLLVLPFITLALCSCATKTGPNYNEGLENVSKKERMNVEYPFFNGEDNANRVIADKVDGIINVYGTDNAANKITYDIVREDDVVTITFNGSGAADSGTVYECGSFNAKTGKILRLKRFGPINDKFVATIKKAANAKLAKIDPKAALEYSDAELKEMLLSADSAENGDANKVCSYSSSSGAFIRIGVSGKLGGFVEIRIPGSGI